MNLCVRQATVAKNNMAEVELNSINIKKNNNHRFKNTIIQDSVSTEFFHTVTSYAPSQSAAPKKSTKTNWPPFLHFFCKKTQFRLGFEVWC